MKIKKSFLLVFFSIVIGLNHIGYCEEYNVDAGNYYNQGIINFQQKNYQSAIINFQNAINADPTFVDAYFNLASLYNYLNQKEKAISTYAKLLKINPNDYDATYEISKCYFDIGSYSVALKYLSQIPSTYDNFVKVQSLSIKTKDKIKTREEQKLRVQQTVSNPENKSILFKFTSPTGIASDSKGNIYVANYTNDFISKITPQKAHLAFAKNSLINSPVGIAIDKFDNLYVANYETNNILKITPTAQVSIFMQNIKKPYYLYIKDDILYISEQTTNTVIKYNLNN